MEFKISLDFEQFGHKPSSKLQYKNYKDKFGNPRSEVSVIGSRLGGEIKVVTTELLAKHIELGQTWSPYTFKECPNWKRRRRLEGLFESAQVLALDFDNGETLEYIKNKSAELGLVPNIIHTSFSSTPTLPKHRAIFVCSEPIIDFTKAKLYSIGLAEIFNSDKACVDAARLYFGSKAGSVVSLNSEVYNSLSLLEKLCKNSRLENFIKYPKCEPKEIEWGDTTTQKEIFDKLPRTKLNKVKSKIKTILFLIENYDGSDGGSRYNALWKNTSKIARMPEVTGKACYQWVAQSVEKNPHYANWEYNPQEVITSAIEWSFNHADDPI
jgi:hypothetical protein